MFGQEPRWGKIIFSKHNLQTRLEPSLYNIIWWYWFGVLKKKHLAAEEQICLPPNFAYSSATTQQSCQLYSLSVKNKPQQLCSVDITSVK